jgi:spore coat polysaccharide biosynthesis protein SpsF (cytidylyltransferase family)
MTADAAAFVYARSDSRRLPGKIFLELGGHKVIDIVHARAARLDVGRVVVLTTDRNLDDPIVAHCADRGYACFRGDAQDLVRRTLQALDAHAPRTIVRVNGDCPLFEPRLVNVALAHMDGETGPDMVSNIITRSFPYGIAVECIDAAAYRRHADAAASAEREHVTLHLYRLADRLSLCSMRDADGDTSDWRLTLDTPQDALALARLSAGYDVVATPYWEMLGVPAPAPVIEPMQ